MKKTIVNIAIIFIVLVCSLPSYAQGGIPDNDRQRWLEELRGYKHDFITAELELSQEQQNEFFPIYDEMEDEIERLNIMTRELEDAVNSNDEASDIEIENAARTIFELKRAEGQIEMTYFEKFKEILSPRQLLQLKNVERKFTNRLVKHHRRMRNPNRE